MYFHWALLTGPVGHSVSQAAQPVKNLTSWVGDTVSAKGDVGAVRKERDGWRTRVISGQALAVLSLKKRKSVTP